MSGQPAEFKRLFTVEEANATLPLVRAIVTDLVRLSRDVLERRERLLHVRGKRDPDSNDLYSEELAQIEDELEKDSLELATYVDELRAIGVEPKNGLEGIVDFPCQMEGRIIFLCWKQGEPEVLHWHEIDAGFAGRQPLVAGSV